MIQRWQCRSRPSITTHLSSLPSILRSYLKGWILGEFNYNLYCEMAHCPRTTDNNWDLPTLLGGFELRELLFCFKPGSVGFYCWARNKKNSITWCPTLVILFQSQENRVLPAREHPHLLWSKLLKVTIFPYMSIFRDKIMFVAKKKKVTTCEISCSESSIPNLKLTYQHEKISKTE